MSAPWIRQPRNGGGQLPDIGGSAVASPAAPVDPDRGSVLTTILRRRRRPLLLVIDGDGELVFSSLPESAPATEQRLLGQALAEARCLFQGQRDDGGQELAPLRAAPDPQGQRSTLVSLGTEFFCLRVIPLHGSGDDSDADQYAALVEPITEPLAKDVDFNLLKGKYRLSNREGDVLEALMTGARDKEIAQSVGLSTGTVRSYLKSIRAKLGVNTRAAIVNLIHEFAAGQSAQNH
jgi:DNA-binding CsgD family transcriptional regulator